MEVGLDSIFEHSNRRQFLKSGGTEFLTSDETLPAPRSSTPLPTEDHRHNWLALNDRGYCAFSRHNDAGTGSLLVIRRGGQAEVRIDAKGRFVLASASNYLSLLEEA